MIFLTANGVSKLSRAGEFLRKRPVACYGDGFLQLDIEKHKFTAITGASGSVKTTLLNIIAGQYQPAEETVIVDGIHLERLDEDQLTVFRRRKTGFVFQDYNLIQTKPLPAKSLARTLLLIKNT